MRHRPRRRTRAAALVAVAACAAWIAVPPTDALAFGGARLTSPAAGIGLTFNGTAYPRVSCAPGTDGFCHGTITIRRRGRHGKVIGRAPLAIRSGDSPSVEVPLRGGRRTRILRRGRAVIVTIRVRDNAAHPHRHRTVTRTRLKG